MKILVLGAGLLGEVVARDLARDADFATTVADPDPDALAGFEREPLVSSEVADLSDGDEIERLAKETDLTVIALPPELGAGAREAAIAAGSNVVDASLSERDPFTHDEAARRQGVTVLVDCTLAPGLSNLLLGQLTSRLDHVEGFRCDTGSLPAERVLPFDFATSGTAALELRAMGRAARVVAEGRLESLPPLSEVETVEVPEVGTLEAIPTDGLRTLLETVEIPNLAFRSLRYPGHAERMRLFLAAGLLDAAPRQISGTFVSPLAMTSDLLESRWALEAGRGDLTVLAVETHGAEDGEEVLYRHRVLHRSDPSGAASSATHTAACTCASVARIVARGLFERPGVAGLEELGGDETCSEYILRDLTERGIVVRHEREPEPDPRATQLSIPTVSL